ncbi:hypothetical protein T310_8021, partial [Rasamsonia emersonii CBS 393.64]
GKQLVPNTTVTLEQLRWLYLSVPDPLLPPVDDLSAYAGVYEHPAYLMLNITANCLPLLAAFLPPFLHSQNLADSERICILSLFNYKDCPVKLVHVSGNFWVLGTKL